VDTTLNIMKGYFGFSGIRVNRHLFNPAITDRSEHPPI